MKKPIYVLILLAFVGCSSTSEVQEKAPQYSKKHPVVTIETSGDLYYEEGGHNVQMDLFGNCATGRSVIYVEIDKKKSATNCQNGRYRFSMNLPKSFFSKKSRKPSSKYVMKQVSAYHDGHKKLSATSYILIDRKKKEVKSVINKQVKFERIPTGEYEPVTQYNAFGSCTQGSLIKVDVTSPDRYGHEVSKYDEKKECQKSGGFYFLSQIHGYPKKGTQFKIYEDKAYPQGKRTPASKQAVKYKNLFNWAIPIE